MFFGAVLVCGNVEKAICSYMTYFGAVLGELVNEPAERTVASVDPVNLNQVILAEGNMNAKRNQSTV